MFFMTRGPFFCHSTSFSVGDPVSFGLLRETSRTLEGWNPTHFSGTGIVTVFETRVETSVPHCRKNGHLVGDPSPRTCLLYLRGEGGVWVRMTTTSEPVPSRPSNGQILPLTTETGVGGYRRTESTDPNTYFRPRKGGRRTAMC